MFSIPSLIANWRLILSGLAVLAVVGYVLHCEHVKSNWETAQAIAQRQAAENAKIALRDLKNKERTDENYQRNITRLAADVKRLRNARPSFVPAGGGSPGSPEIACFDRSALDDALREFAGRAAVLIGEGEAARIGLDEAKAWASGR